MNRIARASAMMALVALAAPAWAQPSAEPAAPAATPDNASAGTTGKRRARLGKAPAGKLRSAKGAGAAPAADRPPWLAGEPPAGWVENPGLSRSVATALRQARPFGELPSRSRAVAYVQPGVGAFYLAWLVVDAPAPDGVAAVRGALDHLRESRVLSSPQANSTEEVGYSEELADGMARARLEWRHLSNETSSLVESAVWLSADGKPRLASAECVASTTGGKTPAAVDKACRDALATFAVTVPAAERGALAALPAGTPVPEPVAEPEPAAAIADGPRPPSMGPARPGAGDRVLYTGPPAAEPEGANRWMVMLGIGLLVAAAYLTLRARRRSEAEPETSEAPESDPAADSEAEIEADAARDDSDPEKSR